MESVLDDDPKAMLDPWDNNMQPVKNDWLRLSFTH